MRQTLKNECQIRGEGAEGDEQRHAYNTQNEKTDPALLPFERVDELDYLLTRIRSIRNRVARSGRGGPSDRPAGGRTARPRRARIHRALRNTDTRYFHFLLPEPREPGISRGGDSRTQGVPRASFEHGSYRMERLRHHLGVPRDERRPRLSDDWSREDVIVVIAARQLENGVAVIERGSLLYAHRIPSWRSRTHPC